MKEPKIETTGAGEYTVKLPVTDGFVTFLFEEIEQRRSHEIEANIAVWEEVQGRPIEPYVGRLNILSPSAKETIRRGLDEQFGKGGWTALLNRATSMLKTTWQEQERSVSLADVTPVAAAPILFPPFFVRGSTILYGPGESGKTMWAVAMARARTVPEGVASYEWTEVGPTLYVDYEADEDTLAQRAEMLGGRPRELRYWRAGGIPFHEMLPGLKREIRQWGISYLIVDSAALACGGEPQNPEASLRYFNALGVLGLPSLTIAHVTKDQKNMDHPFGSIFWSTSARSTVLCELHLDGQDETVSHIGLFHKKSNNVRRAAPMGLRLTINGTATFEQESLPEEFDERLSAASRIRKYLLGTGKAKKVDISEATGLKPNTVKVTLQRMPDAMYEGELRGEGYWFIVAKD